MVGSWLRPFLNWVSPLNLHKYGAVLNSLLPGILANTDATKRSLQDDTSQNVEEVQKIIGYHFKDRNLLRQAFTHPSYDKDCISYERLEYVGDLVLNLMITKQQFSKYPNLPPGLLSPLRAANVDTEKLARVAVKHDFHKYLQHGRPILTRRSYMEEAASVVEHNQKSYVLGSRNAVGRADGQRQIFQGKGVHDDFLSCILYLKGKKYKNLQAQEATTWSFD